MKKLIKIGLVVTGMAFFMNMLLGGSPDKEAEIPSLVQNGALVVDTRTPGEFAGGHIGGAVNIPYDIIEQTIGQYTTDRSKSIIVYCHSGGRSAAAKHILEKAGYTNVINAGGYQRMQKLLAQ